MTLPKEWRPKTIRQRRIDGCDITSVIIVPNTHQSELLDKLIQKEAQLSRLTGYSIKLVEGNGIPLSRLMPAPIPNRCWKGESCPVCPGTKHVKCSVRNVLYTGECLECVNGNGKDIETVKTCTDMIYVGETSRSLGERALEHIEGGQRLDTNNFITKHWLNRHNDLTTPPTFRFTVVRVHKDPMSRCLDEALMIEKANENLKILNSKNEWSGGKISRITVEKSTWETKKITKELEEEEARQKSEILKFRTIKKLKVSFDNAIKKLMDTRRNLRTAEGGGIRKYMVHKVASKSDAITDIPGEGISNNVPSESGSSTVRPGAVDTDSTIETAVLADSETAKNDAVLVETNVVTVVTSAEAGKTQTNSLLNCFRSKERVDCSGPVQKKRRLDAIMDHLQPKVLFGVKPYPLVKAAAFKSLTWRPDLSELNSRLLSSKPNNGLLWERRNLLDNESGGEVNVDADLTPLDLNQLFNTEFDDEYQVALSSKIEDNLVSEMYKLHVGTKRMDVQEECLDDPFPDYVLDYLKLVSKWVDDEAVPNLFRNQNISPMSNWLANVISSHKLKSPFDFELAISRELGGAVKWDTQLIDKLGGSGTSTDAIFELKRIGNFRGVKRCITRKKTEGGMVSKCPRLDELID